MHTKLSAGSGKRTFLALLFGVSLPHCKLHLPDHGCCLSVILRASLSSCFVYSASSI